VKIRRGAWNEELFRVLEGFPDLAHDDEVDACSGALEMLNPRMKGWASYELARRQWEELKQQAEPQLPKKEWAVGSVEWQAEQDRIKYGPTPATPAEEL
jgi:hypothetical protein